MSSCRGSRRFCGRGKEKSRWRQPRLIFPAKISFYCREREEMAEALFHIFFTLMQQLLKRGDRGTGWWEKKSFRASEMWHWQTMEHQGLQMTGGKQGAFITCVGRQNHFYTYQGQIWTRPCVRRWGPRTSAPVCTVWLRYRATLMNQKQSLRERGKKKVTERKEERCRGSPICVRCFL